MGYKENIGLKVRRKVVKMEDDGWFPLGIGVGVIIMLVAAFFIWGYHKTSVPDDFLDALCKDKYGDDFSYDLVNSFSKDGNPTSLVCKTNNPEGNLDSTKYSIIRGD